MLLDQEFKSALKFGEDGEHAVAEWLAMRGSVISPLYQFQNHNHAPFLIKSDDGVAKKITLPDLNCWNRGNNYFVEVKRKSRWVNFVGHKETGFNYSHYKKYLEVENDTGVSVWVFFIHETQNPTGVFVGKLSEIKNYLRYWDGVNERTGLVVEKPMALFPFSCLRRVCGVEELQIKPEERIEC